MATVRTQPSMELTLLLSRAGDLSPQELDEFTERVIDIRAHKVAPVLNSKESELLNRINNPRPVGFESRYSELIDKHKSDTITTTEQDELIAMNDQAEHFNAIRVEALADLARLRGVPVSKLARKLGFRPRYA